MASQGQDEEFPSLLEHISTHWPEISDQLQFALRYARAVHAYLRALIKNPHDAEDVAQAFLLHALHQPFKPERVISGRFRDYLKGALRLTAITHFRKTRRLPPVVDPDVFPAENFAEAEVEWNTEWRNSLLQRTWEGLEKLERESPDGLAYTVLRLATDYPDETSTQLAQRVSDSTGRAMQPDAFRKQLSRARRHFAGILLKTLRQTLSNPSADEVLEELQVTGLMPYVRDYLTDEYRDRVS